MIPVRNHLFIDKQTCQFNFIFSHLSLSSDGGIEERLACDAAAAALFWVKKVADDSHRQGQFNLFSTAP